MFRQLPGKQRHEGGVERALGKQTAEDIGELQRHEEGVTDLASAKKPGDEQIAHEAQHAAAHGPAADGRNGSKERHAALLTGNLGEGKAKRVRYRASSIPSGSMRGSMTGVVGAGVTGSKATCSDSGTGSLTRNRWSANSTNSAATPAI